MDSKLESKRLKENGLRADVSSKQEPTAPPGQDMRNEWRRVSTVESSQKSMKQKARKPFQDVGETGHVARGHSRRVSGIGK